jgi:iron complex outermembrane recepter protein
MSLQVGQTTSTTQYLTNIPKVRSQGIEADISFAPTELISFTAAGDCQ